MSTEIKPVEADDRGILASCPQCGQRNRLTYERLGQTFRCGECHTDLATPAEPIEIKNEATFNALISHSAFPVLVDFWAPWCGPCKMVGPEIAKVAAQNAGQWVVAKVNTEALPGLAERFRISGVPTLAIFEGGREITRQSGAMPAASIQRFMDQSVRSAKAAV